MSVVFTCLVYIAAQYKGISNVYIGSVGHLALIVELCKAACVLICLLHCCYCFYSTFYSLHHHSQRNAAIKVCSIL